MLLSSAVLPALVLPSVLLASSDARAADPVTYQTTLVPTGNSAIDAALRGSSALITLQKTHAVSPFALAGRARGDEATLRTALESFGFYAGHITITEKISPVSFLTGKTSINKCRSPFCRSKTRCSPANARS